MYAFTLSSRFLAVALVASSTVLVVSGCDKKEKGATQVVASVDGEEISVH